MDLQLLYDELKKAISGKVFFHEPLSRHTTWRIGGPADILACPVNSAELKTSLKLAAKFAAKVTVMGNGSNMLVLDGGIRGLVLKTANALKDIRWTGERAGAGAGSMLPALSRQAARRGLSGLEFGLGLPATVGGAVVMNAGIPGKDMAAIVSKVHCLDYNGENYVLGGGSLEFGYRSSTFLNKALIITEVEIMLKKSSSEEVTAETRNLLQQRKIKQPLEFPNAGSIFANPSDGPAGYYLEQAGLKGLSRGEAQISQKHANFIINRGKAKAEDVLWLIDHAKLKVLEQFGVELKTEIRLLGEP